MQQLVNVIAVYVMAVTSLLTSSVTCTDQATKDYILTVHNNYRAKEVTDEHADNIVRLVWDADMEAEAEAWAARCEFKHKGMGENLAWDSQTDKPETELVDNAMKGFFDEKTRYSYGQQSCGTSAACHYTQLVWAKTTKVGCATKVCEPLRGAYNKAWFLVCRYDPAGNWNGEKPFEKGATCSQCPEGATCDDQGLCVGGKLGGSGGSADVCEDASDECAEWAGRGECDNNSEYMHKSCKKSCNKC